MLRTSSSGGINAFTPVTKAYYSGPSHGFTANTAINPNYDSSFFSAMTDEKSRFQMDTVSRLSYEVRTATTTGRVQELRQAVSSGTYVPDPAEITKRILLHAEG